MRRLVYAMLTGLLVQGCGPAENCSDMVGVWKGELGTVVIRKVAAKRFAIEFPASSRSLDAECRNGVLAGESPIRATLNASGMLVLDGFPGGEIEAFAKTGQKVK
jgi:hypothetical protein